MSVERDGQQPAEVRFEPLLADRLGEVLRVEQRAYAHPWSHANFLDALHSGYQAQMLVAPGESGLAVATPVLLGYFVAMKGVDEVHLLNITVAPEFQGQGWSRLLLDAMTIWARGEGAQWLWLEVRVGNARAIKVYEAQGYRRVGLRKAYYPAGNGQREDAIVMSLRL
jgi:ribosomal-protein-alanine N-acetyltransferase